MKEKVLMLGKTKGKKEKGQQKIRWLYSITSSMDVNLSKPQETVKDGCVVCRVHGLAKSWTGLNNTES